MLKGLDEALEELTKGKPRSLMQKGAGQGFPGDPESRTKPYPRGYRKGSRDDLTQRYPTEGKGRSDLPQKRNFRGTLRKLKGWYARANMKGTRHLRGPFSTEEEAAHAYDALLRELGSPTEPNFPKTEP